MTTYYLHPNLQSWFITNCYIVSSLIRQPDTHIIALNPLPDTPHYDSIYHRHNIITRRKYRLSFIRFVYMRLLILHPLYCTLSCSWLVNYTNNRTTHLEHAIIHNHIPQSKLTSYIQSRDQPADIIMVQNTRNLLLNHPWNFPPPLFSYHIYIIKYTTRYQCLPHNI